MKQQYIIPGILSLISLGWIYLALTSYGFWDEGPGGGFMPFLAALTTLGFSAAAILRAKNSALVLHKTVFIPVGLVLALISAVYIIGMLPALFLMLLVWFKGLEHYSWRFSLLASVCVIGAVWVIFQAWLNVPFPTGLIGR